MTTTFSFRGRTRAGEVVRGERVAGSVDAVVAALQRDEILVTWIDVARVKATSVPRSSRL